MKDGLRMQYNTTPSDRPCISRQGLALMMTRACVFAIKFLLPYLPYITINSFTSLSVSSKFSSQSSLPRTYAVLFISLSCSELSPINSLNFALKPSLHELYNKSLVPASHKPCKYLLNSVGLTKPLYVCNI